MPLSARGGGGRKWEKWELSVITALKKNVEGRRIFTHTINKEKLRLKHANSMKMLHTSVQ